MLENPPGCYEDVLASLLKNRSPLVLFSDDALGHLLKPLFQPYKSFGQRGSIPLISSHMSPTPGPSVCTVIVIKLGRHTGVLDYMP